MSRADGFTLIEVLVYLALFAVIIGGGMVAVYQIIESTNKTNDKVVIQEDANFLLRKLDWALTGAKPSDISNVTATTIRVNKLLVGNLDFDLSGDNLTLNSNPLNSSFVKVGQATGIDVFANPSSEIVQFTFTVNGQRFDETKYLH